MGFEGWMIADVLTCSGDLGGVEGVVELFMPKKPVRDGRPRSIAPLIKSEACVVSRRHEGGYR